MRTKIEIYMRRIDSGKERKKERSRNRERARNERGCFWQNFPNFRRILCFSCQVLYMRGILYTRAPRERRKKKKCVFHFIAPRNASSNKVHWSPIISERKKWKRVSSHRVFVILFTLERFRPATFLSVLLLLSGLIDLCVATRAPQMEPIESDISPKRIYLSHFCVHNSLVAWAINETYMFAPWKLNVWRIFTRF